jgi:hypothetical protein
MKNEGGRRNDEGEPERLKSISDKDQRSKIKDQDARVAQLEEAADLRSAL